MKRLITLGLLSFTTAIQAQPGQMENNAGDAGLMHVGHFLFHIPEGWKAERQGDLFSMTAPDLGSDELLSFLLLAPTSDTNFQAAGEGIIRQVAAALNAQPQMQASGNHFYFELHSGKSLKGWEYSFGNGNAKIPYRNPKDGYVYDMRFTFGVFLAKINGRMERVCYISKDFACGGYAYANTTTSSKWTYGPVVDYFFFSLEFDDWRDVRSSSGKIGDAGIWTGVAYMFSPTFTDAQNAGYKSVCLIFFDNGQVYYNSYWPPYGLENFNTIAAAASDPDHWGTYTWKGDAGVIKMPLQTIPFSIASGKMIANMNGSTRDFEKLPPMENVRLNGTWSEFNGTVSITFTSDGRFSDNGVIRALEHRPTTCNEGLPQKGQGAYEIRNHTIIFHYDGGLTTRATMPGIGLQRGNLSPDKLLLGWEYNVLDKK